MKAMLLLLLTGQLVSSAATMSEQTNAVRTIVVGLSPFYTSADNVRVRNALLRFTLETAPSGCAILVQDAYDLETVAAFQIPEIASRYDSPSARTRELQRPLTDLLSWFNRQTNNPS